MDQSLSFNVRILRLFGQDDLRLLLGACEGIGEVSGKLRQTREVGPDSEVAVLLGFLGRLYVTVIGKGSLNSLRDGIEILQQSRAIGLVLTLKAFRFKLSLLNTALILQFLN